MDDLRAALPNLRISNDEDEVDPEGYWDGEDEEDGEEDEAEEDEKEEDV